MAAPSISRERRRLRARVDGTVQGVGFRPHVHRLADELGLGGWVLNDDRGVVLEVEGDSASLEQFIRRLRGEAPPMAAIEAIDTQPLAASGEREFRIVASLRQGAPAALVSPDTATCEHCLAEIRDPADRRYRYPFTNCTDCGPRLTIITGLPYDRPATTMAAFEICERCRSEYEDPADRRFHAQPNACPDCGPQLRFADRDGRVRAAEDARADALQRAARRLRDGGILALKGIGGFHLACRADDERAVSALRARKHRDEKPFALMAADLDAARRLIELSAAEAALLSGRERPILIARRRPEAAVASAVAPRSPDLGVMLPYSPLHHLLLGDVGVPLVMTSGNLADEPIAFDDGDALARLGGIADCFLLHDRPIHTRVDDSVVRSLDRRLREAPMLIRRSRGYAPQSVALPVEASAAILACGAELKNTFCVAKGTRAWPGHHIGDLKNWETLQSFRAGVDHFERLFGVEPEIVAHDLHPDYLSTRYAQSRQGVELIGVQHHHAHLAACLGEHGVREPAVGAIFDGAGFATDGTVWGGEILVGDLRDCERAGLLFPVRLPGGDAAVRAPWRTACAWLAASTENQRPQIPRALRDSVAEPEWESVCALLTGGLNSPLTTSVGRLFDAVSAIAGVGATVSYEGQGACELEGLSDVAERGSYPVAISGSEPAVIDAREMLRAVLADSQAGVPIATIGGRFHNALATATARVLTQVAAGRDLRRVVLSGGVFQNRLLLERTAASLQRTGLEVLVAQRLPSNDGGIAYGQAAVAASRMGRAG